MEYHLHKSRNLSKETKRDSIINHNLDNCDMYNKFNLYIYAYYQLQLRTQQ
jgi:hypothetical protein